MSSTPDDRLVRLTQAIDDLATCSASASAGLPPEALDDQVAALWSMVEGLDPEIARRRSRYTPGQN